MLNIFKSMWRSHQKRKLRNFYLTHRQLKILFFVIFFALIPILFCLGFIYNVLAPALTIIMDSSWASSNQMLVDNFNGSLSDLKSIFAVFFICYLLILTISCIIFSHRYFGPIVAFKRHSVALKDGSYSSRIKLRKGDEFNDLAHELNDLAQSLENKTV